MRLFVAVDLPKAVQTHLAMLCCGLPGARWLEPGQFHLTLRFIGDVNSHLVPDIMDVLDEIPSDPFSLVLEGIGFFPPRKKPRVLWAGVRKNEQLVRLRNRIEAALSSIGLEPEQRKFFPHITLARLQKTPASKVGRYLEQHVLFYSQECTVDRFLLYSSVLNPKGAKHFVEQEFLF